MRTGSWKCWDPDAGLIPCIISLEENYTHYDDYMEWKAYTRYLGSIELEKRCCWWKDLFTISPKKETPLIYPVIPATLTTDERIVVYGQQTSGEIEFVLFVKNEDEIYVGIDSDHTDRKLSFTYSIHPMD